MAFMYSEVLEKYLPTFYTHIKTMYFLSIQFSKTEQEETENKS